MTEEQFNKGQGLLQNILSLKAAIECTGDSVSIVRVIKDSDRCTENVDLAFFLSPLEINEVKILIIKKLNAKLNKAKEEFDAL